MMRGKGDGAWRWVDRDTGPVELTWAVVFWLVVAAAVCLGVWVLAALGLGRVTGWW